MPAKTELDPTDRRILRILGQDGRASYQAVADEVGLSRPAIMERVKRLEESGYIRGYRVQLDRAKVGLPVTAFVAVRYGSSDYVGDEPRMREMEKHPGVLECHHIAGDDCYILKVVAPDLEGVLPGSPLYVYDQKKGEDELEHLKSLVESEIKNAIVSNTETTGIVLKCDTIGSLEAITELLKEAKVPMRMADIGNITRRDVVEAAAVKEKDRYAGVVLGFSVKVLDDAQKEAQERDVKIFNEQIIYNLVRSYTDWVAYQREHEESILFNELPPICKFQFLKGFIFRRNDPAVFGAEIKVGKLKQKVHVVNEEGKKIGIVHQIQDSGKAIDEATVGMQIAVSIKEPTIGRQINEGDVFYTDINSRQAKQLLERFNHRLNEKEKEILHMLVAVKRKSDPTFGYL